MTRGRTPGNPGAGPGSAHLAALRMLARRDYAAAEVTTRLIARGHAPDDVHAAVAALEADGTINDHRTAAAHVRTATRIKGRGSQRVRRELEARGLAADAIREALAQVGPDDDLAALRRILNRRALPHPLPVEARQRLMRQLLRRGFPASLILRALGSAADDE